MPMDLEPDQRKRLLSEITAFMLDEFDTEVGELRATLVLDFMMKHAGAAGYNQGVADCRAYLTNKLADMEIDLHED